MPVPSETGSSGDAVILSHVPNRGSAAPGPARAPLHLFVILLTGKVLRDTFSSVFRIPLGLPGKKFLTGRSASGSRCWRHPLA